MSMNDPLVPPPNLKLFAFADGLSDGFSTLAVRLAKAIPTPNTKFAQKHTSLSMVGRGLIRPMKRQYMVATKIGTNFTLPVTFTYPVWTAPDDDEIMIRGFPYSDETAEDSQLDITLIIEGTANSDAITAPAEEVSWTELDSASFIGGPYPARMRINIDSEFSFFRPVVRFDAYSGSSPLFKFGLELWSVAWTFAENWNTLEERTLETYEFAQTDLTVDPDVAREVPIIP